MNIINVKQIIGCSNAITTEDGKLLYDAIMVKLSISKPFILNFSGIKTLANCFLNQAIGKLYANYTSSQLNYLIKIQGADHYQLANIKIATDHAKKWYADEFDHLHKSFTKEKL